MVTDRPAGRPDGFVVRILNASGGTAGVGMLVGPREIMTCAHVVNAALGRDLRTQDEPGGPVTVEFPLVPGAEPTTVTVARWLPPPRSDAADAGGHDVAGLVLAGAALPGGAVPARLATQLPETGAIVDVFGYAATPQRRDGAWVEATVRGTVGGGRLQLDATPGTALRIRPGYSGSPVYGRANGQVVGMLVTAPSAGSGERDAYAIGPDQLAAAWPRRRRRAPVRRSGTELTILHVSDPQFGRDHLFGGNGLTEADRDHDSLFARLHTDLTGLADDHDLRPDLIVVTGDLAEWGRRSEFEQVTTFLGELTEAVGLSRDRVAIVPGNHDINRSSCQAYFTDQEADEREPVKPYWPKWRHFAAAFSSFYEGVPAVSFTPDEPWTLFEMPDLGVVVAGLNSTMAESHLDDDHYGWIGEHQLRWFAQRLADYRRRGWLRLAAVHHNAVRGAVLDDENLRDADDLDRLLGEPSLVNLVLHGHTHDGRLHRLSSGLLVLSTGSAAVGEQARPQEVPNQYQLVTVRPDGFTRHARSYVAGQRRWTGDTRITSSGSDWHDVVAQPLVSVQAAFGEESPVSTERPLRRNDFLDQVREATQVLYPEATITVRPEAGYLRVSDPLAGGSCIQWAVGVVERATAEQVDGFVDRVHAKFVAADPQVYSDLVYPGDPAADELVNDARHRGVRLRSFIDYQGMLDLRPLVARQSERLASDRRYPAELYVSQRYRLLGDQANVHDGLLERILGWLDSDDARFITVLGDFGRGKTFVLRQLARCLSGPLPILVELRGLEKAPSLDELLAQHLFRDGVESVDLPKLRYMVRSGRLALLFDGFDELALRVSYDNAADYLRTLIEAATDRAKIVLTSRTQHFQSTAQVRTALGDRITGRVGSRVAVIEDFGDDQILQFLVNAYSGDEAAAQARFDLMADIQDLLGLSHNPRMLSFISRLEGDRLREIQREHGRISAAELYRELVDFWLVGEADRQRHPGGVASFDEKERLDACTALALRLWSSTSPTIAAADLSAEVSVTLTRLAERGYTADQAVQAVGSGTLLARTEDGRFAFIHGSVMEWLVASAIADELRRTQTTALLDSRRLSPLMVDFLCDLAGTREAFDWIFRVLGENTATENATQNALVIAARLGVGFESPARYLTGTDVRGMDLIGQDLRGADLRGTVFSGMRLVDLDLTGADLRGANLSGARLVRGTLAGARLDGSDWSGASLVGVGGLESLVDSAELAPAAITGRDNADLMIVAGRHTIQCLAFSPDGARLAVGRGDVVELITISSWATSRVLSGHSALLAALAFTPDSALLATVSTIGDVRIWDARTGKATDAFSGAWAAATFRIWPINGGTSTTIPSSNDGPTHTASWFGLDSGSAADSNETRFATATNGTVQIMNATTGEITASLFEQSDDVQTVTLSSDGSLLAAAGEDGVCRIWHVTSGTPKATLAAWTTPTRAVAVAADGSRVATGCDDGTIRIWSARTGRQELILSGHTTPVEALAFSPGGALVASGTVGGTSRLWDSRTGEELAVFFEPDAPPVFGVAFSPDGLHLAVAAGQTVQVREMGKDYPVAMSLWHNGVVFEVAFSPDGNRLATCSDRDGVQIWDLNTGQHVTFPSDQVGAVYSVEFSPDGAFLASTGTIWTLLGEKVASLVGHNDTILGIAFSPDGDRLATASADGTARLWSVPNGEQVLTLTGGSGQVHGIAFAPDGAFVVTCADDGTARLWSVPDGEPLATFMPLRDGGAAVLLPDGSYKLDGDPQGAFWWAMKLCRFEAGELDGHVPGIRRLSWDAPILGQ
jgi:WD40 repeat protein/3',5'-cyclic AMP phosphodiesterase CpdA